MKKLTFFFLAPFLLTALFADVQPLEGPDDFPEDAVSLHLTDQNVRAENQPAEAIFGAWGIQFAWSHQAAPVIRFTTLPSPILPPPVTVLTHQPLAQDTSSGIPLSFHSKYPLKSFGVLLAKPPEDAEILVQAYDPFGRLVGEETFQPADGALGPGEVFVGLKTESPEGIARVTIDYGEVEVTEKILMLRLEFRERPEFRRYLAQIADGRLGNGQSLQTTITLLNLSTSTSQATIEFFDSAGNELSLNLDNGPPATRRDFEIRPNDALVFSTVEGRETPVVGYACVRSDVPFQVSALFALENRNRAIIRAAGIEGSPARMAHDVSVFKTGQQGVVGPFPVSDQPRETALAFASPHDEATHLEIVLREEGEFVARTNLTLPARGHRAIFLSELFGFLQDRPFLGTISIRAERPLAVTALETVAGSVQASVPAGSLER